MHPAVVTTPVITKRSVNLFLRIKPSFFPFPGPPYSTAAAAAAAGHGSNPVSHYFSLLHSGPDSRYLRHIHARLLRTGLYGDVILSSKLVLMYSRHGQLLTYSHPVFLHMPRRNVFSWNIIIGELSRTGFPERSIGLFREMHSSGAPVDAFTVPVVLRSCAAVGSAGAGTAAHGLCVKLGLEKNVYVASALVFLYVALWRTSQARLLFDEMPHRDSVLWTTMLSGYAQSGEPESALAVFRDMIGAGVGLDGVVMVSLLLVSSQLGWLRHGKSVHGCSVRMCLGLGLSLGNALVDMYAKCGALSYAGKVFSEMPHRDVISWSALILGHGLNGHPAFALELFEKMNAEKGVNPNSVTFLGALSACAHAGMVEKAWAFWDMMNEHGVDPELKHYACMVDVLGRAGRLVEAERFIKEMPMEPDEAVWGALLAGCRVHGNVEVGERASDRLLGLRPDKSGYYVLLANMYSDAGRFDDAERVRGLMKQMNVGKLPGQSSISPAGGTWPLSFAGVCLNLKI